MRYEVIKSDKKGHGSYQVTLNDEGNAIACTCVHGRSGKNGVCYHKRRAEKARDWREARKAYVKAGMFVDNVDFNAYFLMLASQTSVDEAIERTIQEAPQSICPRCQGKGIIPAFMHVKEGVCFRCKGRGKE